MKKLLSAIVALTLLLTCVLPGALAEVDKKEMVYVLADADGSVNDVIVSERLYNRDGEAQLTDVSRLTDIEKYHGKIGIFGDLLRILPRRSADEQIESPKRNGNQSGKPAIF